MKLKKNAYLNFRRRKSTLVGYSLITLPSDKPSAYLPVDDIIT